MNKYDKMLALAKSFENNNNIKKEATIPLAMIGTYLMAAWTVSMVADMASAEIPRFQNAKQGVLKAVQLAKNSNVKNNKNIVDKFIADGQTIIPLFDVVQNMQQPSAKKLQQLQDFIVKTSSFINNLSSVEAAIQKNMSSLEYAGHLVGKHFGFGIDWTNLKAFQNLLPQLVPTLSLVLSKANEMYNSVKNAIEIEIKKQQENKQMPTADEVKTTTNRVTKSDPPDQRSGQEDAEELFSGFASI